MSITGVETFIVTHEHREESIKAHPSNTATDGAALISDDAEKVKVSAKMGQPAAESTPDSGRHQATNQAGIRARIGELTLPESAASNIHPVYVIVVCAVSTAGCHEKYALPIGHEVRRIKLRTEFRFSRNVRS